MTDCMDEAIRPKILVVEDDEAFRASLIESLGRKFDPIGASGVLEALALLEKPCDVPFSAVVAAYQMPSGTGLDLLRAVVQRWPNMGTLLLAGHTDDPEVAAAKRDATLMVLFKPVDPEAMLLWVDHVVTASGMFKLLRGLRRDAGGTGCPGPTSPL